MRKQPTSFHNQDLSDLVLQLQTLQEQKKESDALLNSLEEQNEHLYRTLRLHRVAVRPNAVANRVSMGSRLYDDRDLIIQRQQAQIFALTAALGTYRDRAEDLQAKKKEKERLEKAARLAIQGPVDLTVAWRPKKNVISERTEQLSRRAAKRRADKEKENKQIESEQRELLLEKYEKSIKRKTGKKKETKNEYKLRREKRIAELMAEEMERALREDEERERMQSKREKRAGREIDIRAGLKK